MIYRHRTYSVYGEPNSHGHIFNLLGLVTIAFHGWNKFTLYIFQRRIIDTRNT